MENLGEVSAEAAASPSSPPDPIAPNERIEIVDALRGAALLGILLVNIAWFAQPFATEFLLDFDPGGPLDHAAEVFVRFVAETKFYAMFSLLFGFGMAIQMGRAEGRAAAFVPLFLRRMGVLFLFGVLHVILLWYGDILHTYAILGCVLLLFRRCRPATLVVWFILLLGIPMLLFSALAGTSFFFQNPAADQGWPSASAPVAMTTTSAPSVADSPFESEEAMRAYMSRWYAHELDAFQCGPFMQQLMLRLENFVVGIAILCFTYPTILAMFLCGLWIARRGFLHDLPAYRDGWVRLAWIGLGLGLPLNALYTWLSWLAGTDRTGVFWLLAMPLSMVAGPALCLGYVAAITLAWQTGRGRAILRPLTFVGRMALSNYLLQSVICTTIFYGYGLGLFGRVGAAGCVGIALAICAVQLPLSRWWLARFRFGPLEWLWRSLSYRRRMPMRVGLANVA